MSDNLKVTAINRGVKLNGWSARCLDLLKELGVEVECWAVQRNAPGDCSKPAEKEAPWLMGRLLKGAKALEMVEDHWSYRSEGPSPKEGLYLPGLDPGSVGSKIQDADIALNLSGVNLQLGPERWPRLGTWRFEPNPPLTGSNPPFSGDLLNRATFCSAALLGQLNPDQGEVVLREGFFSIKDAPYSMILDDAFFHMAQWPAYVIGCARRTGDWSFEAAESPGNKSPRPGHKYPLAIFGLRILLAALKRKAKSLFRHDQWAIGALSQSMGSIIEEGLKEAPVKWLVKPSNPNEFFADPFAIRIDNRLHILYEELNHRRPVGRISHASFSDDLDLIESGVVWDSGSHISYPFLFHHEGRIYCAPETAESGKLSIFQATAFPYKWREIVRVCDNIRAIDPTLFQFNGLWWIAYTDKAIDENKALSLMFSQSMEGPWKFHPRNPVKIDIRSSRPAGPVWIREGIVYRPAQDSSISYGGRVVLNRIVTLTPTSFEEEPAHFIGPLRKGPFNKGLHTICPVGALTVVDCRRARFSPAVFKRRLSGGISSIG